MKEPKTRVLRATRQERRLIAELASRPVFERLDAGDLDIVQDDDWSDVPELEDLRTVAVPARVFRALEAASRKRRTTPERLAARILAKELAAE